MLSDDIRPEGLYSSPLSEWRRAREAEMPQRTGRRRHQRSGGPTGEATFAKANRRPDGLQAELAKTRMPLEIMESSHALLEMVAESAEADPKPNRDGEPPSAN